MTNRIYRQVLATMLIVFFTILGLICLTAEPVEPEVVSELILILIKLIGVGLLFLSFSATLILINSIIVHRKKNKRKKKKNTLDEDIDDKLRGYLGRDIDKRSE